jgi:opacity protein-like surface antigen
LDSYPWKERKMQIRFKTNMLALICCLITSPAFAAETWNSAIVVSAGYAKEQGACTAPYANYRFNPRNSCSEKHSVFRFAYDYQFTPVWGFEISYGDLAKAEAFGVSTYDATSTGAWKMKVNGWAIAGTGTFPIGGGFSLLGKVGGVRAEFDEHLTFFCTTCSPAGDYYIADDYRIHTAKGSLTYGLGLQYDFNKTYAIRAQYENFGKYKLYSPALGNESTITISLAQISAGFVFKF